MKIWHPDTTCLSGGPKTFMKYFNEFFKDELVSSPQDADIIFGLNDWVPIDILKNRKCQYVHRANGVYRPTLLKYPDWKQRNEKMSPHYFEADHVIFQSAFSRNSYFEYIGKTNIYSIIPNGVDDLKYNPHTVRKGRKILLLGKQSTNKENTIINKILTHDMFDSIETIKPFSNQEELLEQLEDVGVAVDPDVQSNCNNLVLELMALGIPVVCTNEGGNLEICLPELISDIHNINDNISKVLDNNLFYTSRVRHRVMSQFDIKNCMENYRRVFEQCIG